MGNSISRCWHGIFPRRVGYTYLQAAATVAHANRNNSVQDTSLNFNTRTSSVTSDHNSSDQEVPSPLEASTSALLHAEEGGETHENTGDVSERASRSTSTSGSPSSTLRDVIGRAAMKLRPRKLGGSHAGSAGGKKKEVKSTTTYKLERTDSMENLLTCPICLDIVFEPVTSPCSHHMCMVCLKRLLEYEGDKASCPKCRCPLSMDPDKLTVNEDLNLSVLNSYAEEMVVRQNTIQDEEKEYREARAERERHDHLMETNPLQLMFESEDDPERRRVLNRDVTLLTGLGFTVTEAQKALFVCSGVHHEALNWLIQHQHMSDLKVPWNMTQLQEQMVLRNARRAMLQSLGPPAVLHALPDGALDIHISTVCLVGTLGEPVWCFVTMGFSAIGQNELIFLIKCSYDEQSYPQDVVKLIKMLYKRAVSNEVEIRNGTHLELRGHSFLGDPLNTGVIFSSYCGQMISGVPLPRAPHLFGLVLRGCECQWARVFPSRLLLRLGRQFQCEYPFPLWSDRHREPVFRERDLALAMHLSKGIRAEGITALRLHTEIPADPRIPVQSTSPPPETLSVINLQLPVEHHDEIIAQLDTWPLKGIVPFLADVARGADSHLVFQPGANAKAYAISLPHSQGHALGATNVILIRDDRESKGSAVTKLMKKKTLTSGGCVNGDSLVMSLKAEDFDRVIRAIRMRENVSVLPEGRMRQNVLGLNIQWQDLGTISSGLGHVTDEFFPSRAIHPLAISVVNQPNQAILPVVALQSRRLECPDIHPRIRILGIALGTDEDRIREKVGMDALEEYALRIIGRIDKMLRTRLLPRKQTATMPPSTLTIHVEILPDDAKYRISKSWLDIFPQAPSVNMRLWSEVLHQTAVPQITEGNIEFQITLTVA